MKNITDFINESLILKPKTKEELINAIKYKIKKEGLGTKEHPLNLNDIDVSKIEDMELLFCGEKTYRKAELQELSLNGYFDISKWDVSNVKDMSNMFNKSNFNGDISKWNVSNVEDMSYMFANSIFDGDISEWNVSNVKNMGHMFDGSKFNSDISKWNVSNVEFMNCMFKGSKFNNNLSNWSKLVKNIKDMSGIFANSPLLYNTPRWVIGY